MDSNVSEERVMFKRINELIDIYNLNHEIKELWHKIWHVEEVN